MISANPKATRLAIHLFASICFLVAGFSVCTTAFAFSVYLTYRELFTIHAVCSWCISSAIIFTLLAAVTTARLVGSPSGRGRDVDDVRRARTVLETGLPDCR